MKKTVLDLSNEEAKKYFLQSNNYFNSELPSYIDFTEMLNMIDRELSKKKGEISTKNAKNYKTSYSINLNKDGSYDWRMVDLINPILYVSLVRFITTKEKHWDKIKTKFSDFKKKSSKIQVKSIPVVTDKPENQKKEQILNWWQGIEQESIGLNLKYKYMADVDISNCYGSIYTHSLVWAIEGEEVGKNPKERKGTFGQNLDDKLQELNFGETHGILQGSVLMDFISEILLGYIDTRITKLLQDKNISNYHIIRYRDDYRIFSNNQDTIEKIIKYISVELSRFKMRLNSKKTKVSNDIITSSIKEAKLYWNNFGKNEKNLDKHLLNIYDFSKKYPNAGYLKKLLSDTFFLIPELKSKKKSEYYVDKRNIKTPLSILLQIMYNNPMVHHNCLAIYSKLLQSVEDQNDKLEIISLIVERMKDKPYNEYFEIWLQRIIISYPDIIDLKLESELVKHINNFKKNKLESFYKMWEFSWVDDQKPIHNKIQSFNILTQENLNDIVPVFSKNEVSTFIEKSL